MAVRLQRARTDRDAVLGAVPLSGQWPVLDPFLFCVHHRDRYPRGEPWYGPSEAGLAGREIGMDLSGRQGWSMYHGERVPGFPRHPHRGFETVTIVREGFVDHSDSLGAAARFGAGDMQWMTAGAGIVHAEMFPLLEQQGENPTELFQIWLNLPPEDKLAPPHFAMRWSEASPVSVPAPGVELIRHADPDRRGALPCDRPPPRSWGARDEARVAIWSLRLAPEASWSLSGDLAGLTRILYVFGGARVFVDGCPFDVDRRGGCAVQLQSDRSVVVRNGGVLAEALLLQGRPIGASVIQHGPFVMSTREELLEAFAEYEGSGFGGWPWPEDGPVHGGTARRFARFPDGKEDRPPTRR